MNQCSDTDAPPVQVEQATDDAFIFPASFAQRRLWFLDRFNPNSPFYNIGTAIRLKGALNISVMQQLLKELVRRHESLRTRFISIEGEPHQLVFSERKLTVKVVDLQCLYEKDQEKMVSHLAYAERHRSFDLSKESLFRVTILTLSRTEQVLVMTCHHIISDGWSMGVLIGEFTRLYEAFVQGEQSSVPELSIQYADFAVWQKEWLQDSAYKKLVDYWKGRLRQCPPTIALPTDRPRQAVQTFRGDRQIITISEDQIAPFRRLCQQEGVTLFMGLLALFKLLLFQYTGQNDLIVGTPIANRNRRELESIVGMFVNTLVMRTHISPDIEFRKLLQKIRETAQGAYDHQDLPFEKLVEEINVDRDPSRNPLFQIMFQLQNVPLPNLGLPGLELDFLQVESNTTLLDLNLTLMETPEGVRTVLEYNTDLFRPSTASRFLDQYKNLLENALSDPHQPLARFPYLTDKEAHQILEWNDTATVFPNNSCYHQLFENQVEKTPDAIALVCGDEQLTYQELNQRGNILAAYLQKLGVGPEKYVGICMERSVDLVVGLLGILKAGGAYVPMDPNYPKDRLFFMLRQSCTEILLTQESLRDRFADCQAQLICLDTDWDRVAANKEVYIEKEVCAENLAYMIFTSGSTGQPKGVQITHQSLINFLTSMNQMLEVGSLDRFLAITTVSFDIATLEIYGPLIVGAQVVLASQEATQSGLRLIEHLDSDGITMLQGTPATWRLILSAGWCGHQNLKLLCGGEALPKDLAWELLKKGSVCWNLYGPTETTVWSAASKMNTVSDQDMFEAIGYPIANTSIYILNDNLQQVSIGVPGQIYIGGIGLARGYVNQPDLTAEKFMPDPYAKDNGSGYGKCMYATGDLARYLPDGRIEFLGRSDHQVKVRGFRIELSEIEACLREHPDVEQVVVVANGEDVEKHLVAYVVCVLGNELDVVEMRRFVQQKLPDYMIPSIFCLLDMLPLTPNGKVDRARLPEPEKVRSAIKRHFVSPRDEVEAQLVEIWEKVLKVKPVGVKDNFFDLGGHSLIAVHLIDEVHNKFGQELPLAVFFQDATVEHLANEIKSKEEGANQTYTPSENDNSPLVKVQCEGVKPPFFCVVPLSGFLPTYVSERFIDLANCMGHDQPFYGLQVPVLETDSQETQTIEDKACECIKALREVQAEGPYHLGGWCNGGVVAFEVARQLSEQGHQIALLALLDSMAPSQNVQEKNIDLEAARLSQFMAVELAPGQLDDGPLTLYEKIRQLDSDKRWEYVMEIANRLDVLPLETPTRVIRRLFQVSNQAMEASQRILQGYHPQIYDGAITLFRAEEQHLNLSDPQLGWASLSTCPVDVCMVPGDHVTMLNRPYVGKLSQILMAHLDNKSS